MVKKSCFLFVLWLIFPNLVNGEIVTDGSSEWRSDVFLVFFDEPGFDSSSIEQISSHFNCSDENVLTNTLVKFVLPAGLEAVDAVNELNQMNISGVNSGTLSYVRQMDTLDSGIILTDYIDPFLEIQPNCSPSFSTDPLFLDQWYFNEDNLNICGVWDETTGGDENIYLFVLDSGIDLSHEEFEEGISSGRITIRDYDDSNYGPPGQDDYGHGTVITGIAGAAHNGVGIMGVAPDVQIVVCDVVVNGSHGHFFEEGVFTGVFSDIADFAEDPSKKIVVLVAMETGVSHATEELYEEFIYQLERCTINHNVLVVAASGNGQGCDYLPYHNPSMAYSSFPALFSVNTEPLEIQNTVVAVGGTSYYQDLFYPSNPVTHIIKAYDRTSYAVPGDTCKSLIDVGAPAGGPTLKAPGTCCFTDNLGILTTTLEGGYGYATGTSCAAAQIAGLAVLKWAAETDLSAEDVKYALRRSSRFVQVLPDGDLKIFGCISWGMHRVRGPVQNFEGSCPYPSPLFGIPPVFLPLEGGSRHVNIDTGFDFISSQIFGSGIPDAHDLIFSDLNGEIYTIYGGTLEDDLTLDSVDILRFYGDLTIPSGVTLTLIPASDSSSIRFSFFNQDSQNGGVNPELPELIVENGGRVIVGGCDVVMAASKYGEFWGGVVLEEGSVFGDSTNPVKLTVRDAVDGLTVLSDNFYVTDLIANTLSEGLKIGGALSLSSIGVSGDSNIGLEMLSGSSLSLFGGGFVGTSGENSMDCSIFMHNETSILCGSELLLNGNLVGLEIEQDASIQLEGPIHFVGGFFAACYIHTGGHLSVDGEMFISPQIGSLGHMGVLLVGDASIDSVLPFEVFNYSYGVKCFPGSQPGYLAGGARFIECQTGLSINSTTLSLINGDYQISGNDDGIGVYLAAGGSLLVADGGNLEIDNCNYGVQALSSPGGIISGQIEVSDSGIHGLFIDNSPWFSVGGAVLIHNSSQDGVRVENSPDVSFENLNIRSNSGSGIGFYNGSSGTVRGSAIYLNTTGFFIDSTSLIDAGQLDVPNGSGGNIITGGGRGFWYYVANLNQAAIAACDGNMWSDGSTACCPASPGNIIGQVSMECE